MIKHILTLVWNKRRSNTLLFVEIFFSFAILFAVFSFVIYNLRIYNVPLGFDTKGIWLVNLNYEEDSDSLEIATMKEVLYQELIAKPEIESVSFLGQVTPLSGSTWITSNNDNGFEFRTRLAFADHNYLQSSGMQMVEGRWFTEEDALGKYQPIVITKKLKDTYFKDKPIVDSILILDGERKIVGVVGNFKYEGEFKAEEPTTFFYNSYKSKDLKNINLRLKKGTPPGFEEDLNKTIAQVTKRSDFIIRDLEARRKRNSMQVWMPIVMLLTICGFLVLNVALGLFGVLWYNISKRKAEIGLRRTLGATQGGIAQQFVGEVFMVAFLGVFLGLFFAVQIPLLNVIPNVDAINFFLAMGAATLLIFILVLLCAFYPSRQAAVIHPAIALHEE